MVTAAIKIIESVCRITRLHTQSISGVNEPSLTLVGRWYISRSTVHLLTHIKVGIANNNLVRVTGGGVLEI